MTIAVKICGVNSKVAMTAAIYGGAALVGLMFYPPSPRFLSLELAAELSAMVPKGTWRVGVFVDADDDTIAKTLKAAPFDMLQFHGDEKPDFCGGFSKPYLKAISVTDGMDLVEYCRTFGEASGLLLDTFSDGARGGTGKVFNWGLVPKQLDLPIVLAGGLSPDNVSVAIDSVSPWAVDVSSGVENGQKGVKDLALVQDFINEVKNADARKFRKL